MKRNRIHRKSVKAAQLSVYVFKAYYILAFLFFVSVFLYLYFIFGSIYSTAIRKDLQIRISKTNSEIAEMEAGYMGKYEAINPNSEFAQKFVAINSKEKIFAKRQKFLGRAR